MEAALPLPLYAEEGKLEAQRCGAQEHGICVVSWEWTESGSSWYNRETEDQCHAGAEN